MTGTATLGLAMLLWWWYCPPNPFFAESVIMLVCRQLLRAIHSLTVEELLSPAGRQLKLCGLVYLGEYCIKIN